MTATTPINRPRGRSRRGFRISPLTKLAVCHPPYAKSTGTMAVARPTAPPESLGTNADIWGAGATSTNPTPINNAIAASFVIIRAL